MNILVDWMRCQAAQCRKDAAFCQQQARSFFNFLIGKQGFWREEATFFSRHAKRWEEMAGELEQSELASPAGGTR